MKKSRGVLYLVLVVAVGALLGFTSIVGLGKGHVGTAKNIKLGLDLAGGVSITYQAVGDTPSSEEMSDTIYKLQQRVQNYSTEASVYQEGDDRISIEIPGVSDANQVLTDLGKPGSLYFICQNGSDGNPNYQVDTNAEGGYSLTKTLEEIEADGCVVLTGSDVKSAEAKTTQDDMKNTSYVVSLTFTKDGTEKFADATTSAYANNESIGIYYDGQFVSVPNVNAAITDGQAIIEGMKDFEEADQLASTIRIGGLKVELEELRSNVVGAQLGQDAIKTSLMAGAIGLAIVFVFMCIVYLLPGFASSLALLIYTALVIVCLNAFNITLTLPGIAGIILGIGMAVDANVIIFARVKEEITAGRGVKTALKSGFQKALSAILDGNITTLIAAIVLWIMGTGSVRGFAQTLALGIVVSMFTALVVTRLIIYSFYAIGLRDAKFYGKNKKERKVYNFVGRKAICFTISIVVIVAGFVAMGINASQDKGGLNYSLEFKGGTSTTASFNEDLSLKEIDDQVKPVVQDITGDANIQTQKVQDSNDIIIKTRSLTLTEREALNKALVDKFGVDEKSITAENISSTVSSEMRRDAVVAVIVATLFMLLYIWFRFKDLRFAGSAVIALLHDVLVVLTAYAIVRISVGNTFIACMLTIVGYSINATIVIFDRIREEIKLRKRTDELDYVVNKSISQTLTRSIYTSFTTFVMVAVLYVMGVSSIREFALPLMVGVVAGGWSSVCITGSLWYVLKTKFGGEKSTDNNPHTRKAKLEKKEK